MIMEEFRKKLEESATRYAETQPTAKDSRIEFEKEKAAFKDGAAWARWFLVERMEGES